MCKRLEHLVTRCSNILQQYVMLQGQITFCLFKRIFLKILSLQQNFAAATSRTKRFVAAKCYATWSLIVSTQVTCFFGMTCRLVCSNSIKFSPTVLLTIQFRLLANTFWDMNQGWCWKIHDVWTYLISPLSPPQNWRDGRGAHQNVISASTGAAKAVGKVIFLNWMESWLVWHSVFLFQMSLWWILPADSRRG